MRAAAEREKGEVYVCSGCERGRELETWVYIGTIDSHTEWPIQR